MRKYIVLLIGIMLLMQSCATNDEYIEFVTYNQISCVVDHTLYSLYNYNRGPYQISTDLMQSKILCSNPICDHTQFDCISYPMNRTMSISTDGNALYMYSYIKDETEFHNVIWRYDIDTQETEILYEMPFNEDGYPSNISVYNGYVYFYTYGKENYYLSRIPTDGGKLVQLDIPFYSGYGIAFSDNYIYYINNGVEIIRYNLLTKSHEIIYECPLEIGSAIRINEKNGILFITYRSYIPGMPDGYDSEFEVLTTYEYDTLTGNIQKLHENADIFEYCITDNIIFYTEFKRVATGEIIELKDPTNDEMKEYMIYNRNDIYCIYNIDSKEIIQFNKGDVSILNLIYACDDYYIIEGSNNGKNQYYKMTITNGTAIYESIEEAFIS